MQTSTGAMRPQERLRLVQFNVENLFLFLDLYKGQDLKKITEAEWRALSSSSTQNKALRKTWALADIVKSLDPDILMLNEVGGQESLDNFNKHFLDSQYDVYLKEGNSLRGIDVGYLIHKRVALKAVLLSHKNRPLNFLYPHETQTPAGGKSHYFSRDVAELRLFKPGVTSPSLVILLTHLKSKLDTDKIDGGGRLRRAAELKALIALYQEIKKELGPEMPIVIAGDLNGIASRTNTETEFLPLHAETDLIDSLELIKTPLENRFTQVQFMPGGRSARVQIDYIFVSPALADRVIPTETFVHYFKDPSGHVVTVPNNLDERLLLASDHYPVVLTLNLG
jgi:endonuclease/exonuclease/phosphatase family metal-dependent hydrolase